MKKFNTRLALYSTAHFAVDFACAYLILSLPRINGEWMEVLLLYNFFAFAGQMPLGLLADWLNHNGLVASAGAALVTLGYVFSEIHLVCAVIAGLGNALFHVGGGLDVLNGSTEKSGALGVFVSPGAFGIYFGALLAGHGSDAVTFAVGLCLLILAAAILMVSKMSGQGLQSGNVPVELNFCRSGILPAFCLFLVVCLRSYVGMILTFDWKTGYWSFFAVAGVVLGKTAGGLLADRFGVLPTAVSSLALSAVLFCLPEWAVPGVLTIFFFNMTMPITLWAMARLLPGAKGFSFGLLTFALFLGFVPVWLGLPSLLQRGWQYALAALLSLFLLTLGLKKEWKK